MSSILRRAIWTSISSMLLPIACPVGATTVSDVGNSDGTLIIGAGTGSGCFGSCLISLNPANANTWTATQTFSGNLESSNADGFELVGGVAASSTVPTLVPNQANQKSGIGADVGGDISFICDFMLTAAECGRIDKMGRFTLFNGAEQIGTSSTSSLSVNTDNSSAFLLQGTVNPSESGTLVHDSLEITNVTIAPSSGDPQGIDSEVHKVAFADCSACTTHLNVLAGHSNQLSIGSNTVPWQGVNPIPLVSSYNPGPLINNSSGIQVKKYVLYDSPSTTWCGQNGTTLTDAECDGVLIFGSQDAPGSGGTLSLYDANLTIPAPQSALPSGATENAAAIYIQGNCTTYNTAPQYNCFAIEDLSSAEIQFDASQVNFSPVNANFPAWMTNGIGFIWSGARYTDTAGSSQTNTYMNKWNGDILSASTGTPTYTNVYEWDFEAPTCNNVGGGTVTCTHLYSARFGGQVDAASNVISENANGFELVTGAATATAPTLVPNQGSPTTGIGGASGSLNFDVSGVSKMDIGATTLNTLTVPSSVHVTMADATIQLPGLANAAGNELVCFASSGGLLTYESSVSGCVSSLEELKNNHGAIGPEEAHRDVAALKPFWGTFKADKPGTKDVPFFGARYTAKVDPRLGGYDDKGKLYTVQYAQMTPVLAANEQYLQSEIVEQKQQIEAQKQDIADLRKQVALLLKAKQ
jgi:hypothetical protein